MGLPLVAFLIDDLEAVQRDPIEAAVLISLAPVIIFFNVASVAILAIYNEDTESNFSWARVVRNVVSNPILLACLAGLIWQKFEWQVPSCDRSNLSNHRSVGFSNGVDWNRQPVGDDLNH